MTAPPPIDAYLDTVADPAQRAALSDLRGLIRRLLPDTVESVSYAMPAHRPPGPGSKVVIGYAAFARHCGIYPRSGSIVPVVAPDFPGFRWSKGGFPFTPDKPLPEALVKRPILLRLAEIARHG